MMKQILRSSLIFLGLLSSHLSAAPLLREEFYDAEPRIQLYMAYAEFKMGHHDTAREMWLNIQGRGEAEAKFNLGNLYDQGVGVNQDTQQAIQYYRASAEAGSRASSYQLGLIYLNHPKFKNKVLAEYWLSKAAVAGDDDAAKLLATLSTGQESQNALFEVTRLISMGERDRAIALLIELSQSRPINPKTLTRLAWFYESGNGVEQDIDKAAKLFRQAAEAGDAEAQYALSIMLSTGVGQPINQQESELWLQKAAAQNFQAAQDKLAAH